MVLPACASLAAPPLADVPGTDHGKWVDEDGKTRYVIDKDTLARQECVRLRLRRELAAGARGCIWQGALAYKGQRLCRFAIERKSADTNGNGFKRIRHMAQP